MNDDVQRRQLVLVRCVLEGLYWRRRFQTVPSGRWMANLHHGSPRRTVSKTSARSGCPKMTSQVFLWKAELQLQNVGDTAASPERIDSRAHGQWQ